MDNNIGAIEVLNKDKIEYAICESTEAILEEIS